MRRRPHDGGLVCISGGDPLNLCGTLLPGDKVPALAGNRSLFRDGAPVANVIGGQISYLSAPGAERDCCTRTWSGATSARWQGQRR
jgi:ATP-dependent Lhr-like helicase